jgi:hypothetical protein
LLSHLRNMPPLLQRGSFKYQKKEKCGIGTPGSGSGTLTVTIGPKGDTITAMTGTLGDNELIGTKFNGGTSLVDLDTSGIAVSTVLSDFHIFADGSPFSKGTVSGNDIFESGPNGSGVGTLAVTAAVPEPSTWAMMILGFCGLGFMAFRRGSRSIVARLRHHRCPGDLL